MVFTSLPSKCGRKNTTAAAIIKAKAPLTDNLSNELFQGPRLCAPNQAAQTADALKVSPRIKCGSASKSRSSSN
jgi:hypothetical protein